MTKTNIKYLDRKFAIPKLITNSEKFLIVSGLAGSAKDIGHLTRESPNVFLFGGAMGGALSTSLGLALSKPCQKILCVSGDGDILMSLGSLATIGSCKIKNLLIICIDNESYLETGNQKSHTANGINLDKIASGCGLLTKNVVTKQDLKEASLLINNFFEGPLLINLKVNSSPPPNYSRNFNAYQEQTKFRSYVKKI